MPSIRSTVLLTLTLALSSIDLCVAKDYSNTCTDIHMAGDCHSLVATCTAFKGNKKTSKLDLNHCFGNDNGFIVPSNDGNAFPGDCRRTGYKCELCGIHDGGIMCLCPRRGLMQNSAWADLDEAISNHNGVLSCFGHVGEVL
ncbi:CVNH domain-containing protein [Aspergillus stella-maris]|uniref:CVNH domain-containing protein n=1 Tax=Aspergillus stella-maris TaxID=1810926 RepID=UPI003CCCCC23